MEDAATAEIGRSQLWQWVKHGSALDDGRKITQSWLDDLFEEEKAQLTAAAPDSASGAIENATALLKDMTQNSELVEFLTLPAYQQLTN